MAAEKIYKVRLLVELNNRMGDFMISVGVAQTGLSEYLEPEVLLSSAYWSSGDTPIVNFFPESDLLAELKQQREQRPKA